MPRKTANRKLTWPRAAIVWVYADDDVPVVFLDEGQNFKRLIRQFNKQDAAMVHEENPEGPAHRKWLPFETYMVEHGCQLLPTRTF